MAGSMAGNTEGKMAENTEWKLRSQSLHRGALPLLRFRSVM
jgi:hypothetical protein